MFKKKVGRPSNAYKRKIRNIKILGITSIIGIFGILLYGVSSYSEKLNASVNTDTLFISDESRNLTNKECVEDVYLFKINSTSGEIKSITYSTNKKKWYKLKNNITYDNDFSLENNKTKAIVTIRKSYEQLYIKAKNSKGEKVFGPFYVCRQAQAYVSAKKEQLENATCHISPFDFQISSNTGIKSVYYSIDGGSKYKNKINNIVTEINKQEKYVNITVNKSYNNLRIRIKDTLNNYKEFGPYNINLQKNCENTNVQDNSNNQTTQVVHNNEEKNINIQDDYVKCDDNQVKEYIISHNVDLKTCEHIIKYNDNSEEKYNISSSNYLQEDPKPLVSKLVTNDNKKYETTNLKEGTYILKFYNNDNEVRNDSLNKIITVKTPKQETYAVIKNIKFSIDSSDDEIKQKFDNEGYHVPCRDEGKVRVVINKNMIEKIEIIDPERIKTILQKDNSYPVAYNNILKKISVNIGKYDDSSKIYAYFYIFVPTKDIGKMRNVNITGIKDKDYTGKQITQDIIVKLNGKTIEKGKDYKVTYKDNINNGKATIIISGIGNYTGSISKKFNINKKNINSATIKSIKDQLYSGKALTPIPNVSMGSTTLKEKIDYSLSYKDNKNVGTATITITGIGNYTGIRTIKFNIVEKKVSNMKVNGIQKNVYTKPGVKFTITANNNIKAVKTSTNRDNWKNSKKCTIKGKTANCTIDSEQSNLYYKVITDKNEYQIFGPYCTDEGNPFCK